MSAQSTNTATIARVAIGAILDGQAPNGVASSDLGPFADVYLEMARAHDSGGTAAAKRAYAACAGRDARVAALMAGDPEPPKKFWTADEILTTQFPEPVYCVPGVLPVGLVFLAGRPKMGKSLLGLQIAIAVGSGGKVLGQSVRKTRVLYLALEDGMLRTQERMQKQHAPLGMSVTFAYEWEPLARQGTADLIQTVDENRHDLVIIDTLSAALGSADQMSLADMNVVMGGIQRFAIDRQITVLCIDHHTKSAKNGDGDPVDDIMGSTSKGARADAAMGLYRKRGQRDATLKITGRDIEERELSVAFDRDTITWQLVGEAEKVVLGDQKQAVLDVIRTLGKPTHREIADATGQDRGNCFRRIQDLVAELRVIRIEGNPTRFKIAE